MSQTHPVNQEVTLSVIKTACSNCNLRELCLPYGLSIDELERLDDLVSTRRRVKRGDHLYRAGEVFDAIYAIRSGFFKTDVLLEDGRDQVTGFQMAVEQPDPAAHLRRAVEHPPGEAHHLPRRAQVYPGISDEAPGGLGVVQGDPATAS